jgi:excisionase family DNA binding protein
MLRHYSVPVECPLRLTIDNPASLTHAKSSLFRLNEVQMGENDQNLDYRDPEWVAVQLGIDKNTVYKYLQEGSLPGLQLGRKWLVSERRLALFLERVEREQTEHRRQSSGFKPTPFALPPRARIGPSGKEE